ncbi:hypothetical protein [Collimonas humicola]|uniref:hypothetical protein n=1 Tax=Collimonas humicola TaxID=2825886 RepID=UPI001B8D788E|nr:hypothetical protein [Collimonas humicola]
MRNSFPLHAPLIVICVLVAAPATAVSNDTDIDAAIKAVSRDYSKSLKSNVVKNGSNDISSDVASSNIARKNTKSPDGSKTCPPAPSGLTTFATSMGIGLLTGKFYPPLSPEQRCDIMTSTVKDPSPAFQHNMPFVIVK